MENWKTFLDAYQVGGQHEHGMVHVHTLSIPAQQVLAGKRVA
jgi:hypothetical protein